MSITTADVAKRAGVGKTTVSRVLNAKSGIARETAERVRSAIEELGFVPSSTAVGLARGRTGTVGVLIPFGSPGAPAPLLKSQWMAQILQAASDELAAAGYGLVGFDDIPLASQAGYPLTTVRQPLPEMGRAAARLLPARLGETRMPAPEHSVVIPTDLVVRKTAVAG